MLSALVDEMNAILETEQYRQRGVKNRGGGVYRPSQLGIVWRRILEDRGVVLDESGHSSPPPRRI